MKAAAAPWSRASWDGPALRQDSTRQNQSLATEHKEQGAHMCTVAHHTNKYTFTKDVAGSVSWIVIPWRADEERQRQGCVPELLLYPESHSNPLHVSQSRTGARRGCSYH